MRWPVIVACGLLLAGCNGSDEEPVATPAPTANTTASPTTACTPYSGPPDGSARHPYLKRSMALECREDVKQIQAALGLETDGFYDNDVATAVIAEQRFYPCITVHDGQVGQQTWSLIVDGKEPCARSTGEPTPPPIPSWARCDDGTTDWALLTDERDQTVLRRCGDTFELLFHGDRTLTGAVEEFGGSACAVFDDSFSAPSGQSRICVSDPAGTDGIQAVSGADEKTIVFQSGVDDRYLKPRSAD